MMTLENDEHIKTLLEIKKYLTFETEIIDSSLTNMRECAVNLIALSEIRKSQKEHLVSLIDNYNRRVRALLNFIEDINTNKIKLLKNGIINHLVIFLYDEILVILLLAFSICDYSQKYIFDETFRNFLKKNDLMRDKYYDLKLLGDLVRKGRLFDPYTFPIVLSVFLKSCDIIRNTFAEALDLAPSECDEKIDEFTESFIYLLGIRNQIAHMSKGKCLYSIDNLKNNIVQLSEYFSKLQDNLKILMALFYKIANELRQQLSST